MYLGTAKRRVGAAHCWRSTGGMPDVSCEEETPGPNTSAGHGSDGRGKKFLKIADRHAVVWEEAAARTNLETHQLLEERRITLA